MKINGVDTAAVTMLPTAQKSQETGITAKTPENKANPTDNILLMTDYEKKELPISEKVLIEAIEKANRAISGANRKFEFSIHEKTKEIMIKVIDSDTNEVVREIPPEKILDMVAKMWEMAGLFVDERR